MESIVLHSASMRVASLPHFLPFFLSSLLPQLTNGLPEGHLVGASNPTRIRIVRGRSRELLFVGGVKSRTQIWLVVLEEDLPSFDLDR